ncbi:MAG: trimeric autotransporter adhesin, partial [Thermoleophilaceae bacterium]|nr:trimeric autotransporter adhesin [Thermoleophilaceae bacterium]
MLSHLRSTRLLLVVLVSATALFAMPSLASAASPDHVSTSLEGCRPASTFTGPPFICPDGDYTSGNLGKFWNELDLVPHRLTLATGTDNTSGYTVTVAADSADGNCGFLAPGDYALSAAQITQANIAAGCMPGYDFISAPTLNP